MSRLQERRPLAIWILVLGYGLLGMLVLALAAVVGTGTITWDVKGFLLTGWRLALFSSAVGVLGAMGLLCGAGLWKGRRWARPLALGFWVAAGGLGLITDRSVPGPGEPLQTYLLNMMLIPAAVTGAAVYGLSSTRRYFSADVSART